MDANRFRLAVYGKRKLAFAAVLFTAVFFGTVLGGVAHRSPPAPTGSKISSGRSGTESKRVPRASSIALTIAGAGPSIGSSPIPFAPYAPCTLPISSKNIRIGGRAAEVGKMHV